MTDQPIPATAPVSGLSVSTQQSGPGLGRTLVTNAPVKEAPSTLQDPAQPLRIQGTVVSSNPQMQELRIATPNGQVTVQSPANLPPDTAVILDLSTQKGVELATITVLRQQAQLSEDVNQILAPPSNPPPPLQAGDVMQAILLPLPEQEPAAAVPATIAPPTLPQLAEMIQYLPPSALPQLPGPLPLPPQALIQIATASNILRALQQLPLAQQAQIAAFVARPDVAETLKRILPPEVAQPLEAPEEDQPAQLPQAAEPQAAPPEEDPLDDNILQIVQVQTGARMAQEAPQAASSPAAQTTSPLALLKGFLPLLQTLEPQVAEAYGGFSQSIFSAPAASPGTPLANLMPQNMYQVKIVALTPPEATPLAPPPGSLQGVVESVSPKGFPVVRAGNDLFVLKTLAQAPQGTTVTFEAKALTPEQAIATAATEANDWFDPLTSSNWPALQETLQTITQSAPMLLPALNNTIPSVSPNLAPSALFFLAAVNTGDIENWLGPPVLDALRLSGKSSLAQRLGADFVKIAAQTKNAVPGEWRATSLPLRHDADISQLQLFVRQQQDNPGQKKEESGGTRPVTRFILNLRLSRLGDMQLDGLLHQKRFDLILRSADALSAAMRQELRQHFQAGLRNTDMAGDISFQTRKEAWVSVAMPLRGTSA